MTTDEQKTRDRIKVLLSHGYTPRVIAARLGITTQAVYQHMERLRDEAEQASA